MFVAIQHGTIREAMMSAMQRQQNGQGAMSWLSVPITTLCGATLLLLFH